MPSLAEDIVKVRFFCLLFHPRLLLLLLSTRATYIKGNKLELERNTKKNEMRESERKNLINIAARALSLAQILSFNNISLSSFCV
jgi:hypothetical protein